MSDLLTMLRMRVSLRGSQPKIWRSFEVPSDFTFYDLHDVLQIVMGWENAHLFQFVVDDVTLADPEMESEWDFEPADDKMLSELLKVNQRFIYEYDFGDSWEHELVVEGERPMDGDEAPRCLDGARACPPEDCGGIYGYKELLEILADPDHEDYEQMQAWIGDEFDPEAFWIDDINAELQGLADDWSADLDEDYDEEDDEEA